MEPVTAAALISGGAALVGGIMNNNSNAQAAREASQANLQSNREQMDFQRYMSSTAHQREVLDLRAAGLNPTLSAGGGGASTPSGASGGAIAAKFEDPFSKSISSALETRRLSKELDAVDSQTKLNSAIAETQEAQKNLNIQNAKSAAIQAQAQQAQLPAIQQQAKVDKQRADIEEKTMKYDETMKRVRQATGIVSDALSLVKPKIQINRPTREIYVDKNTGEVLP